MERGGLRYKKKSTTLHMRIERDDRRKEKGKKMSQKTGKKREIARKSDGESEGKEEGEVDGEHTLAAFFALLMFELTFRGDMERTGKGTTGLGGGDFECCNSLDMKGGSFAANKGWFAAMVLTDVVGRSIVISRGTLVAKVLLLVLCAILGVATKLGLTTCMEPFLNDCPAEDVR
jgi:hypothetical protein